MTTSAQDAEALSQVLLSFSTPNVNLEEVYERLTEAHSAARRALDMAHCIPNDVERSMEETLRVYLAAGEIAERYREIVEIVAGLESAWLSIRERAEAGLCDAMHATGAPEILAEEMRASLAHQTQHVVIENEELLPLDVFVAPPAPKPRPSIALVRKKLLARQPCPGARLVDAEPKINIKSTVAVKKTNHKGRVG